MTRRGLFAVLCGGFVAALTQRQKSSPNVGMYSNWDARGTLVNLNGEEAVLTKAQARAVYYDSRELMEAMSHAGGTRTHPLRFAIRSLS